MSLSRRPARLRQSPLLLYSSAASAARGTRVSVKRIEQLIKAGRLRVRRLGDLALLSHDDIVAAAKK